MPAPGEHKTIQARILAFAQEIGWAYVPRDKAERRLGFTPHPGPHPSPLPKGEGMSSGEGGNTDEARKAPFFFGDLIAQLLIAQIRGQDLDLPELKWFLAENAR